MVVAGLTDAGPDGVWARHILTTKRLVAPHLMMAEAANILRRLALANQISWEITHQAHNDLVALPVQLLPYAPFFERIFSLGTQLTCYDAWYVAVAERMRGPLATLDRRLARSPGAPCAFALPPPIPSAGK